MGCKGCGDEQPKRGKLSSRKDGTEFVNIKCLNGHVFLNINLIETQGCVKFGLCDKEQRKQKDFCMSARNCDQFSNNVEISTQCPICGMQVSYFISGKTFVLTPLQENQNNVLIFIKDIQLDGNVVRVELGSSN